MRPALAAVFFLSGAAALLFETLWFRQALLAFGSSVWASSLVLSSFMAGMALGNAGAARLGPRVARPGRLYAALEVLIAILGVGLVALLPRLGPLLAPVFGAVLDVDLAVQPLRFAVAFVLLLGPSAAMGATLPLLVRALSRRAEDFGGVLGLLYGFNTLGAVVGAVAGEMLLIERLGVLRTGAVAGSLNGLAAAGALWLASRLPALDLRREVAHPRRPLSGRHLRLLAAGFLSGGILLALQVAWFRLLVLFVAGTSQAFAVMLGVVLAGIAIGGLVAAAWSRRRADADRHAWAVALVAGAVGLLGYGQLELGMQPGEFNRVVIRTPAGMLLCSVLMFPTALASGVFFTLLGKRLNDSLRVPVRSAGLLTFVNTLGSAIGPLVAGFVLLPGIGVEGSVFGLCALYGVVAGLAAEPALLRSARAAWLTALAFGCALLAFPFGRMEALYLPFVYEKSLAPGATVVARREGLTETILLGRIDFLGEPVAHQLMTDGYAMSTTLTRARRYMGLFAYIPAALHPAPKDALLISYGVGNTAAALLRLPEIDSVQIVDISRDILSMAEHVYPDPGENPLRDPRVRVQVEDGRYFLQTAPQRYDLITGEPPPPNLGHVSYLYTREYFQLAHDRLRPGGILSYWLPVHQVDQEESAAIIGAFCAVFDDCSLWNGGSLNWILVGSRGGVGRVSDRALDRLWRDPATAADLRSIGVERPASLGALFIADASQLAPLARLALPVRDDFPLRIHNWAAPVEVMGALAFQDGEAARMRFAASRWIRDVWPESLRREALAQFRMTSLVERFTGHVRQDDEAERLRVLRNVLESSDLEVLPLLILHGDPRAVEIARRAPADPPSALRELMLAHDALARRQWDLAATLYEAVLDLGTSEGAWRELAIYAHCRAGHPGRVGALRRVVHAGEEPRELPRELRIDPGVDGCWAAAFDPDWKRGL